MGLFGTRLSNLYQVLPCIVAELAVDVAYPEGNGRVYHDRGSRAYFILRGENPLEEETAEVFVRTKLNVLKLRELPWDHFRFAEIVEVKSIISERCWHANPQEMKEMLDRIREKMSVSEVTESLFTLPPDLL